MRIARPDRDARAGRQDHRREAGGIAGAYRILPRSGGRLAGPRERAMKPAPFKYLRAETPQHAVQLLAEHGDDARLLAGGQTLIPMMNLRLARAEVLIDIGRLPLSEIS